MILLGLAALVLVSAARPATGVEPSGKGSASRRTDFSFFRHKTREPIDFAESASGDLWNEVGHHGPAIENEWVGYRIYFDKKAAVDVYSKPGPRLELRETGWYLPEALKGKGYGTDHYFVGNTIGFGSMRLWDDGEVKLLHPVRRRSAKVVNEGGITYLDFLSEGVPYKNGAVDLLLRLTVYAGYRHATLEAFVMSDEPVELVTGINLNPALAFVRGESSLVTWGKHESPVADSPVAVGAAVVFDPKAIRRTISRVDESLLVTKPTKYFKTWLTSANEREALLNTPAAFQAHVDELVSSVLAPAR